MHRTKEVRQQKSTKSIKHQKSSKSNEVKPTKKFKNAKELINLKEVKNTKEVKTHILVFLPTRDWGASATGMRRMAAPDYGKPGNRDLHSPRKVDTWGAINVLTSFSSGECEPT